jgi:hypothetical protein
MIPAEGFMLFGFAFCPFIFYALFYFGLAYLIISPWAIVLLNLLRGFLALRRGMRASTLRVSPWWQAGYGMLGSRVPCIASGHLDGFAVYAKS